MRLGSMEQKPLTSGYSVAARQLEAASHCAFLCAEQVSKHPRCFFCFETLRDDHGPPGRWMVIGCLTGSLAGTGAITRASCRELSAMDTTAADGDSEKGEHNQQENKTDEEQQPGALRESGEGDSAGREVRGSDGAGAGEPSQAAAEGGPKAEEPKGVDPQIRATKAAEGQAELSAKRTRQKSRKAREEDHAEGSDDDPAVRTKDGGSSGNVATGCTYGRVKGSPPMR
jgi:hypothetical protein